MSFKKFIPGIAWFFLVLVLICLPGEDLPQANSWMEKIFFDKWVHAGLFGMLALLFMWPFLKIPGNVRQIRNRLFIIAIVVSAWGLATEFIQKYFIAGRQFDLLDWAADSFGALTALIFILYVSSRRTQIS